MNKVHILNADASRRAALLVACIRPVCALLAPRRAGASTPGYGTFISGRALTESRNDRITRFRDDQISASLHRFEAPRGEAREDRAQQHDRDEHERAGPGLTMPVLVG